MHSSGYGAVITEEYDVVILRHPGEHWDMERLGLTYEEAGRQGRFVACRMYVCRDCGGFYEKREIAYPVGANGCLVSVASGIVAGFVTWIATSSVLLTVGVIVGITIALLDGIDRAAKAEMKRQASGSGLTVKDVPCRCMQTDQGLLVPLGSEARKAGPFPCSACGGLSLGFEIVGIS